MRDGDDPWHLTDTEVDDLPWRWAACRTATSVDAVGSRQAGCGYCPCRCSRAEPVPSRQEVLPISAATIEPEPVPLERDEAGGLMVVGTRVALDTLVAAFQRGESPEEIHEGFPTVALGDIYAVLTYCVRHRDEVNAYIAERERLGAQVQTRIEAAFPSEGLRAKLLARLDT